MKDLAFQKDASAGISGDLVLDPADDLALSLEGGRGLVLDQVAEQMEMRPADDIDFPELYSRQRRGESAHDGLGDMDRIRDAERILRQHPAVVSENAGAAMDNKGNLVLTFDEKADRDLAGITLQ